MSYNTNPGRAEYIAGAGQTLFPYVFKVFVTSNVQVFLTPTGQAPDDANDILLETTDYTVVIDGDNGGTITLVNPANAGDAVTLVRNLEEIRTVEYQTLGDLTATTLNLDQDYQTYLVADQGTNSGRYLTLPQSSQGVSSTLPPPVPLNFMQWNNAGTALINVNSLQADGFLWTAADVYTKDETYSKTEADALFVDSTEITDGKKLWDSQTITHNITTDADYTLTVEQNKYGRVIITDSGVVLTGAVNIIMDDNQKDFIAQNNTAQDLTFKSPSGAGVVVKSGGSIQLYNDGTNVIYINNEIGINQTWQNETSNRLGSNSTGTTNIYTNTNGKPIVIKACSLYANGAQNKVWVDGVQIEDNSPSVSTASASAVSDFIVPVGSTYNIYFKNGLSTWFELK